jgi:hypothetical protein
MFQTQERETWKAVEGINVKSTTFSKPAYNEDMRFNSCLWNAEDGYGIS